MSDSYRRGIVAIIMSAEDKVLIGERSDTPDQWQLPQGGVDKGETDEEALAREIYEEVGVKNLKVLKQTKKSIRYDWPEDLQKKKKWKHMGQEHHYFVLDGSSIQPSKLKPTEEFNRFRWATFAELMKHVVDFRREAYAQALRDLKLLK